MSAISDQIPNVRPADLVLAHGTGPFSRIIRFGQWLRPSWRPYRYWNHAALVIGSDGEQIRCVQMSRRCETVTLDQIKRDGRIEIRQAPDGIDRLKAIDWALHQIGRRYSILTILSIALQLVTPKALDVEFHEAQPAFVCSGFVALAWQHGGWDVPHDQDPYQVTPAELAKWTKESSDAID